MGIGVEEQRLCPAGRHRQPGIHPVRSGRQGDACFACLPLEVPQDRQEPPRRGEPGPRSAALLPARHEEELRGRGQRRLSEYGQIGCVEEVCEHGRRLVHARDTRGRHPDLDPQADVFVRERLRRQAGRIGVVDHPRRAAEAGVG